MAEWQPIETAPKDGSKFLAWCVRRSPFGDTAVGFADIGRWTGHHWAGSRGDIVTHWMPLPKGPEEKADG